MSISVFIRTPALGRFVVRTFHNQLCKWDVSGLLMTAYALVLDEILIPTGDSSNVTVNTIPPTVTLRLDPKPYMYSHAPGWGILTDRPSRKEHVLSVLLKSSVLVAGPHDDTTGKDFHALMLAWHTPSVRFDGEDVPGVDEQFPPMELLPSSLLSFLAPLSGWATEPLVVERAGWLGLTVKARGTQQEGGSWSASGAPAAPGVLVADADAILLLHRTSFLDLGVRAFGLLKDSLQAQLQKERPEAVATWENGPSPMWSTLPPNFTPGVHNLVVLGRIEVHNVSGFATANPRVNLAIVLGGFKVSAGQARARLRMEYSLELGFVADALGWMGGLLGAALGGPALAAALGLFASAFAPGGTQLDPKVLEAMAQQARMENLTIIESSDDYFLGEVDVVIPMNVPVVLRGSAVDSTGLWISCTLPVPPAPYLGAATGPAPDDIPEVFAVLGGGQNKPKGTGQELIESFEKQGGIFQVNLPVGHLEHAGSTPLAHIYLDVDGHRGYDFGPVRNGMQWGSPAKKGGFKRVADVELTRKLLSSERYPWIVLYSNASNLNQGERFKLGVRFRTSLGARRTYANHFVKRSTAELAAAIEFALDPKPDQDHPNVEIDFSPPGAGPDPDPRGEIKNPRDWSIFEWLRRSEDRSEPILNEMREALRDVASAVQHMAKDIREEIREGINLRTSSDQDRPVRPVFDALRDFTKRR